MANSYNYAVKYSTENMVAKAYQEYTDAVTDRYAILMGAVQYVLENVDSDSVLSTLVDNAIADMGDDFHSTDKVPTDNGIITLGNYLLQIAEQAQLDCQSIDNPALSDTYDRSFNLQLIDGTTVSTTLNSILSNMNAVFHAINVENAVATAYAIGGSISDKVSILRDTLQTKFVNAWVDVSDTLNSAVNKVKSGMSTIDYVKDKISASGIAAAATNNTKIIESDDYTISGASPAAAFGWYAGRLVSIAAQQAPSAVSIVFGTAYSILSGIVNVGINVVKKIANKVYKIVANPDDIDGINGANGNHTINTYYYDGVYDLEIGDATLIAELEKGPIHCDLFCGELLIQKDASASVFVPYTDITTAFIQLALHDSKTLDVSSGLLVGINAAFESNYNTLLEAAQDLTNNVGGTSILTIINGYMDAVHKYRVHVMIKPKILNPKIAFGPLRNWVQTEYPSGTKYYEGEDLIKLADRLLLVGPDEMYGSVEMSEEDLYLGLVCGFAMTQYMFEILADEAAGYNPLTHTAPDMIIDFTKFDTLPTVSNYDFFNLCVNGVVKYGDETSVTPWTQAFAWNPLRTLSNVFDYQNENPFDYPFWPYSHSLVEWFDASFRVVSDEEHQAAFNTWLTTAIIVVLVARFAIKKFVKLKRKAAQRLAESMGAEWNVTDLASKGELTPDAIKQWKKAKRRANRMSYLTGNLTDVAKSTPSSLFSNVDNYDSVDVDLSPVISLIAG